MSPGAWNSGARPPLVMRLLITGLLLDLLTALVTGCGKTSGTKVFQREPGLSTSTQYGQVVEPIFRNDCYKCHNSSTHRGGLSMNTYAGLIRGGKDGQVVIPGHAERSLLVTLIKHEGPADHPMPMPPKGKLSDPEIRSIEQWIEDGATK